MAKILVLYHNHCADGFTAAWVAHMAMVGSHDLTFEGATYGKPIEADVGLFDTVFILDFSFPREYVMELLSLYPHVQFKLLDHHKSAQKELEGLTGPNLHIIFDMNKSGALITFEFFYGDAEVPLLVQYVSDRDLWNFELPHSREVSACIFSYEYTFDNWYRLHNQMHNSIDEVIADGMAIERKHHKDIAELLNITHYEGTVGGMQVPCANLPYIYASDAGHAMSRGLGTFAAIWYLRANGDIVVSLRSDKEQGMDVSEIARSYGGGGHPNAAGFTIGLEELRRGIPGLML